MEGYEMSSLVLSSGDVFLNGKLEKKDIAINNGKISKIGKHLAGEKIDCTGKIILPGAIDVHVHFRDFSQSHKEDWTTGSRAAAKGGVTTVFDMVNNEPPITTKERLFAKKELAKKSIVNYGLYFGLGKDNLDSLVEVAPHVCGFKLHMCKTTGDLLLTDPELQKKAFRKVKETGKIIVVHAENQNIIDKATASIKGRTDFLVHADSRPKEAEIEAVGDIISFHMEFGTKTHLSHITTAKAATMIKDAKNKGADVTADTCPTYLYLSINDLAKKGPYAKMIPPVRDTVEIEVLWDGIKEGTFDIISTDHAPHTIEEKEKGFHEAPSGVPGVELRVPLMLDAVNNRKMSLATFVKTCCANPAKRFGLEGRGEIKKGSIADLMVVDMGQKKKVTRKDQVTKCGWSPYEGMILQGWPVMAFVNGRLVYENGKFYGNEGKDLFP